MLAPINSWILVLYIFAKYCAASDQYDDLITAVLPNDSDGCDRELRDHFL